MNLKLILCLALIAFNLSSHARLVHLWSNAELMAASDLVVVGQPIKVKDLDEVNTVLWPCRNKLLGVEATFAVSKVLKGDFTNRIVVLHYYRWENPYKTSDPASAIGFDANSPGLIYLMPTDTNQFLLYLVSNGASRYAPASGQLDSAGCSIKSNPMVGGVNHVITPEQNATNALSTLRVGMTIGEADQDLGRYGGMRVFTASSAVRHSYHYFFIPDMNDITLQFDEHDKLVSWQPSKVAAVSKVKLKFVKVDSEETNGQDGYGKNAVDGDPNTYWHTQWQSNSSPLPHEIIIELIPPSIIKGFTYLPRQDESDHGTIKDYEFYVSNDGKDFGSPVKKGTFEPGKEEKIETFAPMKCRFIKLKAISEINGQPWTSAAEIRVIQSGEDASIKDYWHGSIGPIPSRHDPNKPDAIDSFVAAFLANGGLWLNGIDGMDILATSPQQVVSETLRTAHFGSGMMTNYRILDIRKVPIGEFGVYTAVLADTNLGEMIVLMQNGSMPGYWWRRIYSADHLYNRLY
jgi:hypothetical protein